MKCLFVLFTFTDRRQIVPISLLTKVSANASEHLVMEKLQNTLCRKIKSWKIQRTTAKKLLFPKYSRLSDLWNQRLDAICSMTDAMSYLHKKNILHRDLVRFGYFIDYKFTATRFFPHEHHSFVFISYLSLTIVA